MYTGRLRTLPFDNIGTNVQVASHEWAIRHHGGQAGLPMPPSLSTTLQKQPLCLGVESGESGNKSTLCWRRHGFEHGDSPSHL